MKEEKYTMGTFKLKGYNLYTIYDEDGTELNTFSAFEFGRNAKRMAKEYLKNIKGIEVLK